MKKLQLKSIKAPKIKFSQKMGQIVCGVVILLAIGAYVYIGLLYNDEQEKQDELDTQIQSANLEWQRLEDRTEMPDLHGLLEQRKNELAEEESLFPVDVTANNVMEILLQAADESNVDILPLSGIKPAKTESVGENDYYKVDFKLSPQGTLSNVLNFVQKLEYGTIGANQIGTTIVNSLSLTGKGRAWRANMSGSFYSRVAATEPEATAS